MIPAFFLIVSAVAYRLLTGWTLHTGSSWLLNFAPLAAIALCAAVYLPRGYKFTVPLLALFISDAVLNYHFGASLLDPLILCRYAAFALVGLIGWRLRDRASLATLLPASVAGSTIFYLITNFFSWLTDPGYLKNFAGLIQSLTVGLPAYSATPTWMFFRNSLFADLFFTALFVACMSFARRSAQAGDAREPWPRTA